MMQACATGSPCPEPASRRCDSLADTAHLVRARGGRAGGGGDVEKSLSGFVSEMEVKVNFAALPRFRTPVRTVLPATSRNDRLVGCAQRRQHARQALLLTSVLALSSARSKFSSANDTLSANRCSSSEIRA
jgi:hypothetical protein